MTKKAQRAKTPSPVSSSVVDAMEARLDDAQDHNATPAAHRSGSAKLDRSDKCIIGVFSLGKGAGAGGHHEQIIRAA